ncbi:hypothetical protein Anas_08220 [Armadillidium nasatum]|uniref:Uncharacterized protein n=1 Tax=Armadillidium nasatum TaxID=96803 RepID=A0A5N5TGH5_9CRUS|nr:hypothetical protein Anas_08220 [Armadillidium nasatum]
MKYMLTISWLLWLLLFTVNICWAYKGLYIMNHGTRSHLSFHKAILETLSEIGHKITFVTPYNTKYNIKNVTEILLKENWTDKLLGNPFNNSNGLSMVWNFFEYGPKSCTGPLGDPAMLKALEEDYDYVLISIFLSECFLTVPYVKKIPFIYVFQNIIVPPYSERTGSVDFGSISPTRTYMQAKEENLWPPEVPDIFELLKQPAFAIINSVRALEYPTRPMSPSVVYVGGIHIKEPQPLPQELADWLDGSGEEGFIFFSLGTVIKAEHLKQEHISSILKVFGSLKQRILWKWNSEIKNLPSNVKISSWLPQQDILDIKLGSRLKLFVKTCKSSKYNKKYASYV